MSIILTIIGIILFFGGIIAGCSLKQYEIEEREMRKQNSQKALLLWYLLV